ncbi:MAG: glycoside hydrolase family 92 protein, partial [Clostridia bacterium]|nr:glycoside hydrolase family 92 protein [Clostridia bacterium]
TDGQMYTSNGFWDTYRTAWPAYTLLTPTKAGDLLNGILQHYEDAGQMHRWLNPGFVPSMLGSNSDAIFSDAAIKGVDFDYETAFETIVQNAATIEHSQGSTRPNSLSLYTGYVHSGLGTSVSWEIENNISDYAAAQFAKLLGKDSYATYFQNRSLGYTYLFEPESGFFISRAVDGTFTAVGDDLDPYLWDPHKYGHIETNAWGMAFSIAHDGEGLAALYGGKQAMAAKLDQMLSADPECTTAIGTQHEMFEGRECKMGQYWHSNQPAHSALYMYNYTHQPYKTQRYTREVLDRLYVGGSYGQGYIGDEDNGEQSAWYLLSALGFYPLALGSGEYEITAPLFDKVTLHLESGDVTIVAHNNSSENVYIQGMKVDGVYHNATTITHEDLLGASVIEFTMGNKPSAWGTTEGDQLACPTPMVDLTGTSMTSSKLFDNVTTNESSLTVSQPVEVTFNQPKTVNMVTVTGVDKTAAPKTITVQASNDGTDDSWVTLTSVNTAYTFHFELMPVNLNNTTAYSRYRLLFS